MSTQSINGRDVPIAEVFKDFYRVPDYQREYVWQSEQVEQLLTDVLNELDGQAPNEAPEYFIGSVVVCPGDDGVFDLIDGQQRMTTLFVTLCAIRDRITALGESPSSALEKMIADSSDDLIGQSHFRYRMDLQYPDSGQVLVGIAKGHADPSNGQETRSIRNIVTAHKVATAFLVDQFSNDVESLRKFYGYLINRVKLIRIQTVDVARALKIFETINDRGVGLDSMDLLKNLLFMKASASEFDALKTVWKSLQDTIFSASEKPLRFLRYFIFSRYNVEQLREDQIYAWFSNNEPLCGYGREPLKFANELLAAAKAYANFLNGCDAKGQGRPELQSLQYLGGRAARQHLILLLAGRHLAPDLFTRLVREVENLFFVYVASRENTRDFERNFAKWAPELRAVKDSEALDAFLDKRIRPGRNALAAKFEDAFKRMTADELQVYRLRYILAKLNQHLELEAYGETEGTKWLKVFIEKEFEIEHIQPQNPGDAARDEFGVPIDAKVINHIGNLVLVEKPINASLGNKAYSEKKQVYPKSKLLLVRAIAEVPKVGANTSVDRAVRGLTPFNTWNEQAIASRQALLLGLARAIWGVPATQA